MHVTGPGRVRLRGSVVGALVLALTWCLPALARGGATSGLDKALAHRGLSGARVGVLVIDAAGGVEVYAGHADLPLIPASNAKILTTLAALETFGPTHRFVTEVRADRTPDADGAVGRLVIIGGGDPSLTSEQMWRLAADLARLGLRRIEGELIVDAGAFDAQWWHDAWGPPSARAYHSPVAGLSVNYASFTAEVAPATAVGAAPRVAIDPPVPFFAVTNQARTVAGSSAQLAVDRAPGDGTDRIVVGGSIGQSAAPQQVFRSVSNPVLYAGHVLRQQLQANGIEVGTVRAGSATAGDVEILRFPGKTMAEIVHLCMKYSNNNIAESLVKAIGRHRSSSQGTWASGVAAARQTLIELGVAGDGFNLVDGSGLARDNRVSPRAFVAALAAGERSFRYGPEFVASLPIANRDGTLERRASGARDEVRAKTGLLSGATALSGIARTRSGRRLLFSIIANGYERGDAEAMAALDAFAAALVDL